MQPEEHRARKELEDRAAKIFGSTFGHGTHWPYGLEHPDRRLRKTHPEVWERVSIEQPLAQRTIVEWAERYNLKRSDRGCCPLWLQRKTSRSCAATGNECMRYGSLDKPDYGWLDHPVAWILGGRPAAITSAPYGGISSENQKRFAWWRAQDDRLRVLIGGEGWYGYNTTQVLMWRSDRIQTMNTAPDARENSTWVSQL